MTEKTVTARAPGSPLSELRHDVPAGVVVFLVALPLCLGVALASGAPLASGLVAGVVGGLVIPLIVVGDGYDGDGLLQPDPYGLICWLVALATDDAFRHPLRDVEKI